MYQPLPVSGYVLAGGRSSRMGRDKAMLELAGKPLVEHAVLKLRRICAQVAVLSSSTEVGQFAPAVADLHPDCGPMSGLEAALNHASGDWSLVLPVDVPFLPTAMLYGWVQTTLSHAQQQGTRVALYTVDGVPQPTLVMLHREIAPYLTAALAQGRFKLFPELVAATKNLASRHRLDPAHILEQWPWSEHSRFTTPEAGPDHTPGPAWWNTTPQQTNGHSLYFANLNTPEDFARAEQHVQVLDT